MRRPEKVHGVAHMSRAMFPPPGSPSTPREPPLLGRRYEDYLDSHITKTDLFYLEDVELARQLVELGYR